MNGCPADHEHGHHDHHQPGDPAQVAVLFARARQHPYALQPQNHERVAHGDDEHRHNKGKDKDTHLHHGVPVHVRLGELQGTLSDVCRSKEEREGDANLVTQGTLAL